MQNPLLSSYREAGAAGNYPRVKDQMGVAGLMQDRTNQYGPSHAAFESWKRVGIPTAEQMPSSKAFGMSTRLGESVGETLSGKAFDPPPVPNYARAPAGKRVNPITWLGGESEITSKPSVPRRIEVPSGLSLQREAQQSPVISPEQMQQTWSQLMRSRKLPQSSAQCLIDMPPAYAIEPPPPQPALTSQSLMTIGLHPANGGRAVRRSTQFTSDFRDPFM